MNNYANKSWETGEQLFTLGFLHMYNLAMFLGILFSFLSVLYFFKRYKYPTEVVLTMLIIIVPSSIFGARFWYLVTQEGWKSVFSSVFFNFEGLSIQGGVIFAAITAIPYIYWKDKTGLVDFRTVVGVTISSVLLGQAIGRWGNFGNHEVYGKVVSGESLNWLAWIGIKQNMYIEDANGNPAYRNPLFLYESISNFMGYYLIVWVLIGKAKAKPGTPIFAYLAWYGLTRIIMEPMRDKSFNMNQGGSAINVSTLISWLIFIPGILGIIWFELFSKPFYSIVERKLPENIKNLVKKEYEKLNVVSPIRKYIFFGDYQEMRRRYWLFGEHIPNTTWIWLKRKEDDKWSKRDLNRGYKLKQKPNSNLGDILG